MFGKGEGERRRRRRRRRSKNFQHKRISVKEILFLSLLEQKEIYRSYSIGKISADKIEG
jgi:hypothetical protein